MKHAQVIRGSVPSKSNAYRIVTIHGHGSLAKTKALKEYEQQFFLQCGRYRDANIREYFKIDIDVYYASQRPDLDNAMKVILDCLQACKAIENDRWLVELHARKFIDKYDPRIEFTITPVAGIETRPTDRQLKLDL